MLKRIKGESGSVTIEATISLSAFMFAIVTLLTIVNICLVQARVAVAINTTAKELSQYSYLYSLTGFNKSEAELAQAAKDGTQDIDSIMSDIKTPYSMRLKISVIQENLLWIIYLIYLSLGIPPSEVQIKLKTQAVH